MAMAMGYLFFG